MPSNNRRTSEQSLSSPTRRAKASRGSASEGVSKKSGVRRTKTGDSQSPEIARPAVQIDGLGIDSVRRRVDRLSLDGLAKRVASDVYRQKVDDPKHVSITRCVLHSFRDDEDDFSRGFGPIAVMRAMEVHGYHCTIKSPFICRRSNKERGACQWVAGFTPSGTSGWNGRSDYLAFGDSLAIAVARAAVFTMACIAERKRGGR